MVDWNLIATHLMQIGIALALALPVAYDRERSARSAGLGAILTQHGSVSGTLTAASIWNTGAIGVAVAYHR